MSVFSSSPVYKTTRSLHLYLGLFVSPFVLIFAISVLVINHRDPASGRQPPVLEEVKTIESIPDHFDTLDSVRVVMKQAGISGWVTFFRHIEDKNQYRFIVLRPTVRRDVTVDLENKTVEIMKRPNDFKSTLAWLHVMPGPHTQHKNWSFLFLWWTLADAVVYGVIFLSVTGVYLWFFIKAERKIGFFLITLGILSFAFLLIPLVP